jgi:tetratricopeptide (TPR) repeat protein
MLYSAYKAAKVHALPSWYELPGLVSLEAAWLGCNVVASDWGTIREYLGTEAYYCDPVRPETIRDAVVHAMRDPTNLCARDCVESLCWDDSASRIARVYRSVLDARSKKGTKRAQSRADTVVQSAKREALRHEIRGRAVAALSREPDSARNLSGQILEHFPMDGVAHYVQGVAQLSAARYREAENHLCRAIELAPGLDVSAYLYLALALLQQGKPKEATDILDKSMERYPFMTEETMALVDEYLHLAERIGTPIPIEGSSHANDAGRAAP